VAGSAARAAGRCTTDGTCVTCGDVATPVRILGPGSEPGLAAGADGSGAPCEVEVDLVGPVSPGDVVLVHAGVALTRLDGEVATWA
jgi:hydrogenase expression/formation protein HypC